MIKAIQEALPISNPYIAQPNPVGDFSAVLQSAQEAPDASPKKTAQILETQLVYMAFKSMDQGETPLLGGKMQGLSHFKDQFFETLAKEVVRQKGLGFEQALDQIYG